jgi:uncharacterized protein (TIRG00374 family)
MKTEGTWDMIERIPVLRRLPPPARRAVQIVLSLVLVLFIFALTFRRIDLGSVVVEVRDMTWIELGTVAAITIWNLVTYWWLWVTVTPKLSYGRAAVLTQSGTAVTNTVPGGSAIGVGMAYSMLDSWGITRTGSTLAVLVSGAWNTLVKFALPVLALAIVAMQGDATQRRVTAGLAGIALLAVTLVGFTLVFNKTGFARRAGDLAGRIVSRGRRVVRRPPVHGWGAATAGFRDRAADLLRARWPLITVAALVSHLSLYLVLLVTLRHVGVSNTEVSWAEVLAVFALARLLTVIRFTPGGAGAVEAFLIGGLVAAGGASVEVAAGVVVFRGLTWLLPIPIGYLAYLGWRRRQAAAARAERGTASVAAPPTPIA